MSQLPNLVTLSSLACGLTAIRFAMSTGSTLTHRVALVLGLMFAAAVLDGLDGRLARLLDAQSPMGAQLDSLCDAINFGVAPALITYVLVASTPSGPLLTSWAWLAAMIYAGAIVLRLGRFNVLHETPETYPFDPEFFVGVPAPAAAWLALVPVVLVQEFGDGWWSHAITSSAWLVVVAILAYSRLPTFTFKTTRLPQSAIPLVLLACFVVLAALFTFPYLTILALLAVYVAHIPFAVRQRRFLISHPAVWTVPKAERRALRRDRRREGRQSRKRQRPVLGRVARLRHLRRKQ
ncbi:MAG: phosphatidylcholine/phosphatidylserine synthase [Propionibacteriaceae bacterium]|nr:phosphatidylcholine/phosphatidylserine synthase [Propionibacteriaceae bacterium]